jgi:pantetheine-phosphate adenylyltransferase
MGYKDMTAVYPGSFDPVTLGHLDIIRRAAKAAERLIVAVADKPSKQTMFSADERMEFLKHETRQQPNVTVELFSGMLAAFVLEKKADVIIRGIRSYNDFQYEQLMAKYNLDLTNGIDTWYMASRPELTHISSSAVKEAARLVAQSGFDTGILGTLVPERVKQVLFKRV